MENLTVIVIIITVAPFVVGATTVCEKKDNGEKVVVLNFVGRAEYLTARKQCGSANVEVLIYRHCEVKGIELDLNYMLRRYPNLRIISWNCIGGCTYQPKEGLLVLSQCKGN